LTKKSVCIAKISSPSANASRRFATSSKKDIPLIDRSDVEEALSQSQPPSVDEVERLLDEVKDPFKVDERLRNSSTICKPITPITK